MELSQLLLTMSHERGGTAGTPHGGENEGAWLSDWLSQGLTFGQEESRVGAVHTRSPNAALFAGIMAYYPQ